MEIKLKPWDEVVRLGKERGYYKVCCYGTEFVDGMNKDSVAWGEYVTAKSRDGCLGHFIEPMSWVQDWMVVAIEPANPDDVLRYGYVVTDDQLYDRCDEVASNVCIRLIAYDGCLWFHKTVDGQLISYVSVGKANA